MTNALNPISWFFIPNDHPQNESDSFLPSTLEIDFLLLSAASISVQKISTNLMITQRFNVCNHDHHETWKTLTTANQSKIPMKQYTSVTCFFFNRIKVKMFHDSIRYS